MIALTRGTRLTLLVFVVGCATASSSQRNPSVSIDTTATLKFPRFVAATQVPGIGTPVYPKELRAAGIEGEVVAQFVLDERGRVVPSTIKILASTDFRFTQAVMDALPQMRFHPATSGGKSVHQLVDHVQYNFRLDR